MRWRSANACSPARAALAGALALSLGLLACALPGRQVSSPPAAAQPASTATLTLMPSATPTLAPSPSATPTPTLTATPTRTSTPDRSATAAVQSTDWAAAGWATVQADLWPIDKVPDHGRLGWTQEFPVFIELSEHSESEFSTFAEDLVAADFILKTDLTWDSTEGYAVCGLIFRADPESRRGGQYHFVMTRLSGLPAWQILYYEYNRYPEDISGFRTSRAIDQGHGATNRLVLIAQEDHFTLYVNDQKLGTFYDHGDIQPDGMFGYVASHDSGLTTCTFENTWVWLLEE